ncbi:hypothetical protein PIB30_045654 [Stylosanthes scabra]|uniref:Pentatricopeptide repeat-containing protein n=1 Tax=Stylosanthes scabra TaxID=79078 RepID=A0ABU6YF29_9FABA|nr:hypothetical protein [Stylosanthes scabra]
MQSTGLSPNAVTYGCLISGWCDKGKLDKAFNLYSEMIDMGFTPNLVVCSKIVSSLYKFDRINEATVILDKMVDFDLLTIHKCSDNAMCDSLPNNIVYNIAIAGLCKSGKVEEARSLLSSWLSRGFVPDNFTYCTLIHAYSVAGNVDDAFNLRDEMLGRGIIPNTTTYNELINGLCKLGNMGRAHRLFAKLHRKGLVPNAVTYNILISDYCRVGDLSEASKLREKMAEEGIS